MSHHLSLTQVAIADIESIVGNHFKWGNNCELVMEINLVCAPPRPWAKKINGYYWRVFVYPLVDDYYLVQRVRTNWLGFKRHQFCFYKLDRF